MGESPRAPASSWVRRAAPWVVAAGILAFLGATTDLHAVGRALDRVSLPGLVAVMIGLVAAMVVTDVFALWVAFRESIPAARLSFGQTFTARAPSYLLAIVNYGAGQGGLVYLLKRNHAVPVGEGVGAVLLSTAAYLLVVTLLVGGGLLAGAVPDEPELRWLVIALAAGAPIYLAVVALRPRRLAELSLLKPLFAAGLAGTLRVAAARAVYVVVMLAGHWAAMRLFGVAVPFADALARLPLVFLIGAIPVSPAGLGTVQAAAVALFGDYAPGATPAEQHAVVLAYSLGVQVLGTAMLAGLGLGFLRKATRQS